jgi:FkbM family methyltransferase
MANTENIARARALFADELSLRVFDVCMKYGMHVKFGGEDGAKRDVFPEMLGLMDIPDATKSRLSRLMGEMRDARRRKFIYGAGTGCKAVLEGKSVQRFNPSGWSGIIDNNVTGERYGLPIVSFADFVLRHGDALVLNSVGQPVGSAIHGQCLDAGIDCLSLFEIEMSWNQYFDLPKAMGFRGDGAVFVHAGCFNGDTQKSFINWFGDTYAKMVTFEPGKAEFALAKERLKGLRDVEIVQAGLSDKSGTARLEQADRLSKSFISETGGNEINVVALDEYMVDQTVTFLALDVEGGEMAALMGAKGRIMGQKPKLAISAYHRPEDIWEIPFLAKEYNPNYKLYLRHYHLLDMFDTVMYAF